MKTYKIHLIRHGLTDGNIEGKYIGNKTDLPLNDAAKDELLELRRTLDYPAVGRVYTSPLLRAVQTAQIIYPDYTPNVIEELTEYNFGDFEGKTAQELEKDPAYLEWASGKTDAPPSGEKNSDFIKRLVLGLNRIVLDMMDKKITSSAVVLHGGAIMMLLAACGVPRKRPVEWTSEPGRGYSIMVTPSLYHSSGVIEVYDII